ncbi:hypothetical protein AAFN85_26245 [Mucilaginibacter sp. CAU 1740]|uniref:tetratricopeptide repeat protein n=1 Tax=Mucilaginibacter sp. CAU 1740 TaxID=3140365 RepID=UPI00325BBB09
MNTFKSLILTVLLFKITTSFAQVPSEFAAGLKLVDVDKAAAKANFQAAMVKDPSFFGTYHFLGVFCLNEHKPDSAIWYFKKSIELNKNNPANTAEFAYGRIIFTYISMHDFKNAFDVAWQAYKLFPDNSGLSDRLRDVCLWAYYTQNNKLDPNYSSFDPQAEYVVNSVDEEYLITRAILIDDRDLNVTSQSLGNKNGARYDVLTCSIGETGKTQKIDFKINWDMAKYPGGNSGPLNDVIANSQKTVYERVGAMYIKDNKIDLAAEIKKMLNE